MAATAKHSGVIVVGVDGSDRDRDALSLAAWLARTLGTGVLAVHAHPYGRLSGLLESGDYQEVVRGVAEGVAARVARHLTGVDVEMEVVADPSPAAGLQRLARDRGARMLVAGSSERGRVAIVTPGSTTERIVTGSPCPVAVAPRGFTDPAARVPVGAGYDGSEDARAAVATGAELAAAAGVPLRLVAVFEPIAWPVSAHDPLPQPVPNDALRDALRRRLDEAARDVAGVPVDTLLLDGDAVQALADQSGELAALVVGSRGYGPLRSILLGGVSGRLIREARCPVIVCPRGEGG